MSQREMLEWPQARQKDIQDACNDTASGTALDENHPTTQLQFQIHSCMACGWLPCLQAYRKGGYAAWQLAGYLQLGSHQRRSRRVCDSGCFHVRDWHEYTWSSIELEGLLPWARCSSYSLSAGWHHSEAAGPRLRTAQSIAKELPVQFGKHMLPTVATVNHCRQRRQAHEHFVSVLWWYQPQRCGFVCLAHRSLWLQRGRCDQDVAYKETVSSPVAPSRLCYNLGIHFTMSSVLDVLVTIDDNWSSCGSV